jgi:NAD(P)-dependent dehydrogenase (short-subunit alcohol dehydrogenase family)
MESKVNFIAGVSSGLGRALAEEALSADYHVAGTVRDGQAVEAFETLAPGRAPALTYSISRI